MLSSGFVAFFGSAPAEPFFRPDPALTRLPRAVAVKDGRFLRPPEGLVLDGLRLPAIRFVEMRANTDRPDRIVVSVGDDASL